MDTSWIIERTRERGYVFVDGLVQEIGELHREADGLRFEVGDHVNHPINKGKPNEVRQLHERAYFLLDDPAVPVASRLCYRLAEQFAIPGWLPNEIGYQRYRDCNDWISPHRDRRSDRLFSVTLTIAGHAWIHIYKPDTDPPDYNKITRIDSYLTGPGTAMFLRAPGLGSGEQVIHEVEPPPQWAVGPRLIVNLRMRPVLLKSPAETKYE